MPQNTKLNLVQTQKQVQKLSAQQIMVVKLLELPTVEFEERIHNELIDNPALEEGREVSLDEHEDENGFDEHEEQVESRHDDQEMNDYLLNDDDEIPAYQLQTHNRSAGEQVREIPFSDSTSFYESVKAQISEHYFTEQQKQIAEYLIGSLDDDGLLRKPMDGLIDDLFVYEGIEVTEKEVLEVLKVIQEFDPAGIGARNLQECLLIQIRRKKQAAHGDQATLNLLHDEETVISKYFEEFTHKHKEKIQQRMGLDKDYFEQVFKELTRLNPRPGASLGEAMDKNFQQIIPDFIVETGDGGDITLSLNDKNVPALHISNEYKQLAEEQGKLKTQQSRDAVKYLRGYIDRAQNFIDAIRQRQQTLLTTMKAIIELQRDFFLTGDEAQLHPMILKDVAERAKLDISTVSRVSNSKYVQTNFGIFRLKHFFSDGYTTEDGTELTVRQIQKFIKEAIDGEDKDNPLTDDELTMLLKEKGYPLARRTVAKYRQNLNIPVARLRK